MDFKNEKTEKNSKKNFCKINFVFNSCHDIFLGCNILTTFDETRKFQGSKRLSLQGSNLRNLRLVWYRLINDFELNLNILPILTYFLLITCKTSEFHL